MVHVALAGASTGFGLTLLRHLISTKHDITLLSRDQKPELTALGVHVRVVDYTNHKGLVSALEGVHTIISTIGSFGGEYDKSQIPLLAAAKEAGVKRFAPSDFAFPTYEGIDLFRTKEPVWEAAKTSGLEVTRFSCGLFMNLLAAGTPKGEEEALAGLRPWDFVVNMRAGTADLPGDGSTKVTFTDIYDVCRFVAASLDLDRWDRESGMAGETASFNDILRIIEQVTGRKFLVKQNSMKEMEKMADIPGQRFYNQVRMAIARGDALVQGTLNDKFLHIKPTKIEEFIRRWWGDVDLDAPRWTEDQYFG